MTIWTDMFLRTGEESTLELTSIGSNNPNNKPGAGAFQFSPDRMSKLSRILYACALPIDVYPWLTSSAQASVKACFLLEEGKPTHAAFSTRAGERLSKTWTSDFSALQ